MPPHTLLYKPKTSYALRVLLTLSAYGFALLLFPTISLVLALLALLLVGGFEVIGVGILLDALLAPHEKFFGPYHYTALLLLATPILHWVRSKIILSKSGI